jgi:predicted MPP superfamily phosphohydrolase
MKTIRKTIIVFIFLFSNTITYGQNKAPFLQNIHNNIISDSDTIKIQRYNGAEYHKLIDIAKKSSNGTNNYDLADAVMSIEAYLEARSKGEIPDNPNEIERRFNKLTNLAKSYKVYFNLENYKKEASYYKNEEEKTKERINNYIEQKKREEEQKKKRIANELIAQKKFDSLIDAKVKEKEINDSIEYSKQRAINDAIAKQRRKQEAKIQVATKKQEIEKQTKRKFENEKKKIKRREEIINKYGVENGEAILNHKVKIGWTKSMCFASWGKPLTIYRTTIATGVHEQCVYSLKKYLYFDNGILTAIQD